MRIVLIIQISSVINLIRVGMQDCPRNATLGPQSTPHQMCKLGEALQTVWNSDSSGVLRQ